jgi:hypothetical protein
LVLNSPKHKTCCCTAKRMKSSLKLDMNNAVGWDDDHHYNGSPD